MKNRRIRIALLFVTCLPILAFSSEIRDIRTGYHRSFSRLVVELNDRCWFDVVEDRENQSIVIRMEPVEPPLYLHEIAIEPGDTHLQRVAYQFSPPVLRITAHLISSSVQIKTYVMERPFRVVVDFYRGAPQDQPNPPQPQTTIAAPQTLSQSDSSLNEDENGTLDEAMPSDGIRQLPAEPLPAYDEPPTVDADTSAAHAEKSPSTKSTFAAKLRMGLAALGMMGMVVGYFVWDRRRKKGPSAKRASRKAKSGVPSREQFEQVLHQTIKTKNGAAAKSAEQPATKPDPHATTNPADEKVTVATAVKIDNMIASLDDVLVVSDFVDPARGALQEATANVEVMAAHSGLSKEDLIGKDGEAFVTNLKKRRSEK
jgi:hypothetical protein